MTSKLGRRGGATLIGASLAFAAGFSPAAAQEELRIGLIAPMTGPFAQVGADMTNGFKMYLDEVNSNFAGAKVNLIIEDSQGKPDTAVTKAKKLILEDHVQMIVGGVFGSGGLRAWRRCRPPRRPSISLRCRRPMTSPSVSSAIIPISSAPAGPHRSRIIRSANGPATRATRRSSPSPPTMPSAMSGRRLSEGVRGLRRQDHPEDLAAARHQGFWALYPDHQGRCRRGFLADGRADAAAISQAIARVRLDQADHRRRHQL